MEAKLGESITHSALYLNIIFNFLHIIQQRQFTTDNGKQSENTTCSRNGRERVAKLTAFLCTANSSPSRTHLDDPKHRTRRRRRRRQNQTAQTTRVSDETGKIIGSDRQTSKKFQKIAAKCTSKETREFTKGRRYSKQQSDCRVSPITRNSSKATRHNASLRRPRNSDTDGFTARPAADFFLYNYPPTAVNLPAIVTLSI